MLYRNIINSLALIVIFITQTSNGFSQVGINTTDPQAVLDINSSTEGILIPRISLIDTSTPIIDSPTPSELIYNTSSMNDVEPGFYYWTGSEWKPINNSASIEAYQSPTFETGWSNYGNGYGDVQFYKDRGRVYLTGRASGGSGAIFYLPEGYRPSSTIYLQNYNGTAIYVFPDGEVRATGASTVILNSFSFRVD